jgi:hypothetical protein
VALQRKEVAHLIQCGALDGLGESRVALLSQAEEIERAGSALQMTLFDHEAFAGTPESLAQRLDWEKQLLGYPVSVLAEPLKPVADRLPEYVPLRNLPETGGRPVTVTGVRLPGWTGGEGFYLWDGKTWVIVKAGESQRSLQSWTPVLLRGHWTSDEWGASWLQVTDIRDISDYEITE